jgi:hypothetical protein
LVAGHPAAMLDVGRGDGDQVLGTAAEDVEPTSPVEI